MPKAAARESTRDSTFGATQSRRVRRLLAKVSLFLVLCGLGLPEAAFSEVPQDFRDSRIASFDGATALAFTPDGRLLIAGRTGTLRLFQNGSLSAPALDIKSRICWDSERGMVGVAVDPRFAANSHIYLYYTYDRFNTARAGRCERKTARTPVNRVSRFTLGSDNRVNPASEVVLIDNIPSFGGNHNGGDLGFGNDGYLYVSVGDGGCDYKGDSLCFGVNDAARDQNVLLGKILRITGDGRIPADNPFRGSGTARCAKTGQAAPGTKCRETFAWGLRNPFRFAFDPAATGTRFYINDTGDETWEEIDIGQRGADYGWNVREGPCRNGSWIDCEPPRRGMVNPVFAYQHDSGCRAISGGAFVPPAAWPSEYEGGYLFSDFGCGAIKLLKPGAETAVDFATGLPPVIDLVFGPHGSGQALYYTTWNLKSKAWEVHRITHSGPSDSRSTFSRCGGNVGTSLLLLGLCGAPYLRRRLRSA